MTIQEYLQKINQLYKSGISTEHSYRPDLRNLLESLLPGIVVTNEPSRIECGAPDYILTRKNIPVGYIEAKDVGKDLNGKDIKEQLDRYRKSLDNLILTDYLIFQLYRNGEFVASVQLADAVLGKIIPRPEQFKSFEDMILNFASFSGQTIKSAAKLSVMMAAKARLMATVIDQALSGSHGITGSNLFEEADNTLHDQMNAFRQLLIHDITSKDFADIYAQTIAYGMFAARLHDPTLEDFTRQEAAQLIPSSNPFLRKLFQYIAGYDLDDRIRWIVDDLADIFQHTDVSAILKDFGKDTQQTDPMIHFYETFLSEYNPALRKSRGVWYTPEPVVNFIVRAVDDILKEEFGLPAGLADTSMIKIKIPFQGKTVEQEVHRVQVLDPACGTGTFLAQVIRQIHKKFEGQEGIWSQYVEDHLLPRLNGFEILMASYAMAHLKLELLLQETGYKPTRTQRLKVYLTNSLEEHHQDTGTLFASWLSQEANEANHVKRDTPVMVVLGNPPYSVSSSNKSEWIEKLTADYKKDLNERNIQPLSDDYIKFIRFGQYFIAKNRSGILAYISNNSFIDGIIHRQMRKHLLESFDKIYILDLHGNSKKQETAPDGSPDQNVFDIMQGVSISIFIKTVTKKANELAKVFHCDLYGKRELKYDFLIQQFIYNIHWAELKVNEPNFYLVKKNFSLEHNYNQGISINELFDIYASGIKTHRDHFVIDFDDTKLIERINYFFNRSNSESDIRQLLSLKDNRDWSITNARDGGFNKNLIFHVLYRPLDVRYIYYDLKLIDFGRYEVMRNMISGNNLALISVVQAQAANLNYFDCIFVTNKISDTNMFRRGGPNIFPLYIYPEINGQSNINQTNERTHNLNHEIVSQIADQLNLEFTNEKETIPNTFAPVDLFDYIYAVLHGPTYREKYKEFLKVDFPRVPYPKDQETFWKLAELGSELRQIHLLESPVVEQFITSYPFSGNNEIDKVRYVEEKVWINNNQYFDRVPQIAWEFYIGGYQPAQKWLKDRKGRQLSYEDVQHYQKIIVALTETDRIMKEIDKIEFE
jgi:predicted helicase